MQQAAGQTNATLAQTATALAGVEAQGARLTTTLRETGSSQQVIRTLQEMAASGNAAAGQVAPLIAQLQKIEGEGARAAVSIRQVDGEIKSMSVSVREAATVATPWTQAVQQLAGTIPGLSQAIAVHSAAMQANAAASAQAGTAAGAAGSGLGSLAVAAVPAAAGVAAITAAAVAGVQTFAEYEKALIRTSALTESGAKYAKEYDQGIRSMAQSVAVSQKELAEGLYVIASDGFKGAQALDVLREAAQLSAAGLGKTADIARVTTSVMNAYGRENMTAARAMDVLTAAATEGHVPAENLVTALSRVLPIAAPLGVSFEQVAANIATATRAGASAEQAATGLATALSALAAPGEQAKQALADIGISAADLSKMLASDLKGTLDMLFERSGNNYDALRKIIPEIRAMREAMSTAGAQSKAYAEVLDAVTNSVGRAHQAHQIAAQGTAQHLEILNNRLNEMKIQIGEGVAPKLIEFGDDLGIITRGVGQLSSAIGTWAHGVVDHFAGIKQQYDQLPEPLKVAIQGGLGAALGPAGRLLPTGGPEGGAVAGAGFGEPPSTYGPQPVPGVSPTFNPAAIPDYNAIRASQAAMAALTSEGQHLVGTMGEISKAQSQGSASTDVIRQKLEALAAAEAKQEEAWSKAFDPAVAAQRIGRLQALTDEYSAAVKNSNTVLAAATQQRIADYLQEMATADRNASQQRHLAQEQHAAVAEANRIAQEQKRLQHEARQADVGTGLAEAAAKGLSSANLKADLDPAAAKVMDDFMAALESHGTQSAAQAGKTLGTAIVGIAEQMRSAGVSDWQETMAAMFDASQAIRRGEPGATQAMHDLALHASEAIDQAKIAEAWGKQLESAQRTMEQAEQRHTNAMTDAATKRGNAMADAERAEGDRVADAQAHQHVDTEMREEQHGMELARIKERWAREDTDRAEQQARARTDLAERNARALSDIQIKSQESESQAQRQTLRNRQEAEIQHQERIREITRRGGPGMGQAITDENRQFQESQTRQQRQDQYAAADRQAQAQTQMADATRKQAEATADAAKKQKEAEADLAKSRDRQMADRGQQQADQDAIAQARKDAEKRYGIDPETLAARHLTEQTKRINQQYAHEREVSDRNLDQQRAATVAKLGAGYQELQTRYPWLHDLGAGVALPPSLTPQITAPAGFFPLGPLTPRGAGATRPEQSTTAATEVDNEPGITVQVTIADNTFVGADRASARAMVDLISPELLSRIRGQLTAGRAPS